MHSWYLIFTKPGQDERAEQQLAMQGLTVFRPRIRFHKLVNRVQVAVTESLFPRYIFIHLDTENTNWHVLRSTRGVQRFVKFGEYPTKVDSNILEEIMNMTDDDGIVDKTIEHDGLFEPGDKVEITEGGFRGNSALVQSQCGDDRVIVLLSMLGREQRLSIPIDIVKKCETTPARVSAM